MDSVCGDTFSVVTFPGHRPSPHIDTNPVRRPEKLLCPLTHSEDGRVASDEWAEPPEFQRRRRRRRSRGLRHLFSLSWSDRAAPSLWNRSEFFTEHHSDVRTGSGGERSDVAAAFFFFVAARQNLQKLNVRFANCDGNSFRCVKWDEMTTG